MPSLIYLFAGLALLGLGVYSVNYPSSDIKLLDQDKPFRWSRKFARETLRRTRPIQINNFGVVMIVIGVYVICRTFFP